MSGDSLGMHQFVNPQDTDRRYDCPQLDLTFSGLCAPSGDSKPSESRAESGFRRPSLTISDTRSLDSSTFESSPGCMTPCTPVSAPSTSSSRRQSMVMPAHQQYYLSPGSPSPLSHSPRSKRIAGADHYSLQQPFTPEAPISMSAFMINGGPSYCLEEHIPMMINEYPNNPPHGLPCHQANDDFMSKYEQVMHTDSTASLSADMARNFSFAMGGPVKDFAHPYADGSQTQMFGAGVPSFEVELPHMAIDPMDAVRNLDAPFEYNKDETETQFVDDDTLSSPATASGSSDRKPSTRTRKKRDYTRMSDASEQSSSFSDMSCKRSTKTRRSGDTKKPKRSGWSTRLVVGSSDKKHPCTECNAQGQNVRFVRPEHLVRHKKSHHEGENTVFHECLVHDCIDPKTNEQKKIKARGDNMAPHYNNTHFSWGNSDKSGKNRRISLKESYEIGLIDMDNRWPRFLEGGITVDSNPKGEWKMLGYSILETQNIKVKDIISTSRTLSQQWGSQTQTQHSPETTLKAFDFRWKMLLEGTMDYETAMATGHKMKELERLDKGLLGVTMFESEEMGLKAFDPRWAMLMSGKMKEDDKEKLGVRHLLNVGGMGKRGR